MLKHQQIITRPSSIWIWGRWRDGIVVGGRSVMLEDERWRDRRSGLEITAVWVHGVHLYVAKSVSWQRFSCWETNIATSWTGTPPLAGRHRDCLAPSRTERRDIYRQAEWEDPSESLCLPLTDEWFSNQWKVTLPFPVSHSLLGRLQTGKGELWIHLRCHQFTKLQMHDKWIFNELKLLDFKAGH